MAPKQLENDQGNALSISKRDIFPFMSLPPEIRIQIYKIVSTDSRICFPYKAHSTDVHCNMCVRCWRRLRRSGDRLQHPVRVLLQIKQIRDDMLPHVHLAWFGGQKISGWKSFYYSAIPAVSRLTMGISRLYCKNRTTLDESPRNLLRWMKWNSHNTRGWNLRHLTLIEGGYNWPCNPYRLSDSSYAHQWQCPLAGQSPEDAKALAKDFPMIKGLSSLILVLMFKPGPVMLDKLSRRCKAHDIDLKIIVSKKVPRFVH